MQNKKLHTLKKFFKFPFGQEQEELQLQHVGGNAEIDLAQTSDAPMQDIIRLTEELIAVKSTSTNEIGLKEVMRIAGKQLTKFTIEAFTHNDKKSLLIHNAKPGTRKFKIILNAHLDVVPGESNQYIPYIQDGKLYGRGSYDMKASTAVMIYLFKKIAQSVSYPLALQITGDEEIGTYSAEKQVKDGVRADFVITGECGNNFQITNQAKGVNHIKLTAVGTTSHGAYPWKGDNAVVKLHKALADILEKYPAIKEESPKTTVNVTRIFTNNQATNKTPDHCEAHLDIRYAPADKNIFKEITKLLPIDVTAESLLELAPLDTDKNNEYLKLLQQEGKKILKKDLELRFAHATSDVVRFAQVGCDGVEFGPIGANQHSDNEWVDIKSLENYYQILKNFLLSVK